MDLEEWPQASDCCALLVTVSKERLVFVVFDCGS